MAITLFSVSNKYLSNNIYPSNNDVTSVPGQGYEWWDGLTKHKKCIVIKIAIN
jgi:hypothetical protein